VRLLAWAGLSIWILSPYSKTTVRHRTITSSFQLRIRNDAVCELSLALRTRNHYYFPAVPIRRDPSITLGYSMRVAVEMLSRKFV
jgi:hypothetical protein